MTQRAPETEPRLVLIVFRSGGVAGALQQCRDIVSAAISVAERGPIRRVHVSHLFFICEKSAPRRTLSGGVRERRAARSTSWRNPLPVRGNAKLNEPLRELAVERGDGVISVAQRDRRDGSIGE